MGWVFQPRFIKGECMCNIIDAAEQNDIDKVKEFLASGVDVDKVDWRGNKTSLYFAVKNCNTELVKLLLKHGADPTHRADGYSRMSYNPLGLACNLHMNYRGSYVDLLEYAIKKTKHKNIKHTYSVSFRIGDRWGGSFCPIKSPTKVSAVSFQDAMDKTDAKLDRVGYYSDNLLEIKRVVKLKKC